tara:strand:+ start:6521 stop:6994 length:474 start_codon:yes stop_codon:yes gene_type:complete
MEKKRITKAKVKKLKEALSDSTSNKPKRTRKNNRRTEPEQLTQDLLEEMDIPFEIEKSLRFKFSWKHYDISLLDYPILIEVDGNYWHGNKQTMKEGVKRNFIQIKNKENDAIKNWLAKSKGFKLLRIWEKEIKEDRESVRVKILNIISEYKTEKEIE